MPDTTARVATRPPCDLCGEPAHYDAATRQGPWGYLCEADFGAHGIGLGTGVGQRLVPDDEAPTDETPTDEEAPDDDEWWAEIGMALAADDIGRVVELLDLEADE